MIESTSGVENAEQMIGADGVRAVFVRPTDLRRSMGLMDADVDEPEFQQALQNIVTGLQIRHVKLGFKFIMYQSDSSFLAERPQGSLENAQSALSLSMRSKR